MTMYTNHRSAVHAAWSCSAFISRGAEAEVGCAEEQGQVDKELADTLKVARARAPAGHYLNLNLSGCDRSLVTTWAFINFGGKSREKFVWV